MHSRLRAIVHRLRRTMRSRLPELGRDGDVWNLISGEQYAGRHAESGGVARQEQERAIDEVAQQAEELEDAH